MSTLGTRLDKVMPVLSARERAILVLRSLKDKTPEDPMWRQTMPREQSPEFNRLIVLMNACNIHLPLYITMVEQHAEQMWLRLNWLMTMTEFEAALWNLGSLVPTSKRRAAEKAVADVFPVVELPWDLEEHPLSWLNVSDNMEKNLRDGVAHLWDDLNAIEAVLADVAKEFAGEDPMRPIMRGVLDKTRKELSLLHELYSGKEALAVREPSQNALALAQTYFDAGKSLMERI